MSRLHVYSAPVTPPPHGSTAPEQKAHRDIDAGFDRAGWVVQHREDLNGAAGRGVAVREFPMKTGHGYADYVLFIDERPVAIIEAKPAGHTLSGVQCQARKYSDGLPGNLSPLAPDSLCLF